MLIQCLFHWFIINHSLEWSCSHCAWNRTDALLARKLFTIFSYTVKKKKEHHKCFLCQHTFPILRTTQWGKNSLQRWSHWVTCPYPEWPSHIYSKALPESQLFKHLKKFVFECVCTKPGCRRLGNLVGREILLQWFKPGQRLIHSFQFLLVYASINNTWHLKNEC